MNGREVNAVWGRYPTAYSGKYNFLLGGPRRWCGSWRLSSLLTTYTKAGDRQIIPAVLTEQRPGAPWVSISVISY
jgi:hypothetical protein